MLFRNGFRARISAGRALTRGQSRSNFYSNGNASFSTGVFTNIDGLEGGQPGGYGLDNLLMPYIRVTTAPVPEPASLGLLLAGLAVVRTAATPSRRQGRLSAVA